MTPILIFLSAFLATVSAQQISCNSLNVDSTRQFNNCVNRVVSSSGLIASTDQFSACNNLYTAQSDYLRKKECPPSKDKINSKTSSYNSFCPGDLSAASQSQNKARYCAAASSAAIKPSSTTYSLPSLPTLGAMTTIAPAAVVTGASASPTPIFNVQAPSAAQERWNPAYITVLLLSCLVLML